ncbi:Calmodulin-dependent protein kinase cmk2 [Coemansia sp. RSA 2705]|nr:Calmodulin-dependent protein kinase cmk2 [Coemansia sp. RSA 2705]
MEFYQLGNIQTKSVSGNVHKAVFTLTGEQVAIKVLAKSTLDAADTEEVVLSKIDTMLKLDHPHFAKLLDWFEADDKYYLVFQLCTGKTLFDKIRDHGQLAEADASKYMQGIFQAVAQLHQHGIMHHKLNPRKLVFLDSTNEAPLMLTRYDISCTMQRKNESEPIVYFDDRYWKDVSDQAKDFIRSCMCGDPEKRLTAEQALEHPWLSSK